MVGQDLVDVVVLLGCGCLDHHELEVGALAASVEHPHLDAELFGEVLDYLLFDSGLGRRR